MTYHAVQAMIPIQEVNVAAYPKKRDVESGRLFSCAHCLERLISPSLVSRLSHMTLLSASFRAPVPKDEDALKTRCIAREFR